MAYENHFVYNPSTVDIKRSKFKMDSFWKGAIYHGDLVPVEITRVMPGDSAKYNLAAFIRTATPPIYPFMDTVRLNFAAFYVPERLLWNKEKEFLGENTEGYGIQSEVLAPRTTSPHGSVSAADSVTLYPRSIGTYLGLVRQKAVPTTPAPITVNPIRAFLQVYNDWFRNENFHAPYLWNHGETGDGNRVFATLGGTNIYAYSNVPQVCKQLDRYTSCLPWAQKGSPVLLPLGDLAPVVAIDDSQNPNVNYGQAGINWNTGASVPGLSLALGGDTDSGTTASFLQVANGGTVGGTPVVNDVVGGKLFTDLSQATSATVNEFRLAFATQRYLEALARSGSKYREYIKGMFGVNIGDTTAQMAEYLGGMTIQLNVDQVLQSTGYVAGAGTALGAPGAVSTSAFKDYLFTKSFTEPGFLVIVAYTKHNRTYGQGIDEIFKKHEILEEYNPKFANIGETAIHTYGLYYSGENGDDNDRFGFQESWSEYRHKKDVVIGSLAPSNSSSWNFATLAENFGSKPVLNGDFLKEDRTYIARALSGGSASPDYFLDIKFEREFVRPMPLYSIPGLIDHH